jgi:hypothetical protein
MVTVGDGGGGAPAVISPGFSAGMLMIEGDYQQNSDGEMLIEVDSATQFDAIDVSGSATLGGILTAVVTDDLAVAPGITIEVLTAGSLAPGTAFDDVRTVGSNDVTFVPVYSGANPMALTASSSVILESHPLGDMNLDFVTDAADASALALAFVNPVAYQAEYHTPAPIMGRINDDDYFDFDDISAFRDIVGMPMAQLMQAIREAQGVPEPNGWALACFAFSGVTFGRMNRNKHR